MCVWFTSVYKTSATSCSTKHTLARRTDILFVSSHVVYINVHCVCVYEDDDAYLTVIWHIIYTHTHTHTHSGFPWRVAVEFEGGWAGGWLVLAGWHTHIHTQKNHPHVLCTRRKPPHIFSHDNAASATNFQILCCLYANSIFGLAALRYIWLLHVYITTFIYTFT